MIKNFNESELENNLGMDVQQAPEEIEAVAGDPDCCNALSAVDCAKKDPNTITVAAVLNDEGVNEFYVDAKDVEKYAELNEKSFLESMNDVILCNEESGISADNIVVVVDESTSKYVRNLEKNGAACVFVNEADDITMHVQDGPQDEEIDVSENPSAANPLDVVKKNYDSVVVAKDNDDFFIDVEDVQKCADLNCESVIDTLNNIIAANEDYDMNPDNITLLISENTDASIIEELNGADVNFILKQE